MIIFQQAYTLLDVCEKVDGGCWIKLYTHVYGINILFHIFIKIIKIVNQYHCISHTIVTKKRCCSIDDVNKSIMRLKWDFVHMMII